MLSFQVQQVVMIHPAALGDARTVLDIGTAVEPSAFLRAHDHRVR
ncbi:hypothetical protein ACN27G_07210 [Plantactinospora sp. WMMB334]